MTGPSMQPHAEGAAAVGSRDGSADSPLPPVPTDDANIALTALDSEAPGAGGFGSVRRRPSTFECIDKDDLKSALTDVLSGKTTATASSSSSSSAQAQAAPRRSSTGAVAGTAPQPSALNGPSPAGAVGSSSPERVSSTPPPPAAHDGDDFLWDYEEMAPMSVGRRENPWDCRGLLRIQIRYFLESLVLNGEVGDFIVRDRKAEPGTLALQYKSAPRKYVTEAVDVVTRRLSRGGSPYEATWFSLRRPSPIKFSSLFSLVHYYSVAPREDFNGIQLNTESTALERSAQGVSMLRPMGAGKRSLLGEFQDVSRREVGAGAATLASGAEQQQQQQQQHAQRQHTSKSSNAGRRSPGERASEQRGHHSTVV